MPMVAMWWRAVVLVCCAWWGWIRAGYDKSLLPSDEYVRSGRSLARLLSCHLQNYKLAVAVALRKHLT